MTTAGSDPFPLSNLFVPDPDLATVAAGRGGTDDLPQEAVRRVQEALLVAGHELPRAGVDGTLNPETDQALRTFARDRDLPAAPERAPALTPALLRRLDYEQAFSEGNVGAAMVNDLPLLRRDPALGALVGQYSPTGAGLEKQLLTLIAEAAQLGDTICMRLSMGLDARVAGEFSELVAEPKIFADFTKKMLGKRTLADFFDEDKSFVGYREYLIRNNPGKSTIALRISRKTRPDIMTHRPPVFEWYEIKPMSAAGIRSAIEKYVLLTPGYPLLGYPYTPGDRYVPTHHIPLTKLVSDHGEKLDVYLEVLRPMPALIFWTLCFTGDYVRYFNRVRLVAGLLAILAALAAEAAAAASTAVVVARASALLAQIQFLAATLGLALPTALHRVGA